MYSKIKPLFYACVGWLFLAPTLALAGSVIRDAEIEATLRAYANPIFMEAGIPPEDVRLFIVNDPSVNAFVAGGLNMFLHTGLIREAKKPGMLIGVIAHETGHIAGAHLSQLRAQSTRAMLGGVIGTLIGAAAVAGGAGETGVGIIAGSQNMAMRNFLSGIRVNEQSADHAALSYLDALDISASGMFEMFQLLRRNERGVRADPYLVTHPLSQERMATVRNHVRASRIPKDQVPEAFIEMHARMLAKLMAFTESLEAVNRRYPASDNSLPGRYARAIAAFRANQLEEALRLMQSLKKARPNDPFFYDTEGQILFESGKLRQAEAAYARAHSLLPDSALIMTDYAKTLLATEDASRLHEAIKLLEQAIERDDSNGFTWRQLAIAYGRQGNLARSYLALAQEASVNGDTDTTLQHLARVRALPSLSPSESLEADDLERDTRDLRERQKEQDGLFLAPHVH